MDDYQKELNFMIPRWSPAFISYFMVHVHNDIEKYALWTMEAWNYPTTENSILTSNQCEHINRVNQEQQDWQEMPVDKAFLIGRDMQKAKVYEMARGMMGLGNLELLPEFRSKFSSKVGEDLLRRLGSTPSFDQIVARHKETRDLTRHAGRPTLRVVEEVAENEATEEPDVTSLELDGELLNVHEIIIETDAPAVEETDPVADTSLELQEVSEQFDMDDSFENPTEEISTPRITPSMESPEKVTTAQDEITYIPSLDTYFSPGRTFPVSVQLKKNLCNQCGYCQPRNWCSHLRNAGIKAGMNIREKVPVLKSLTVLRKNQRADRSKSGKKAPRRFDIIPLHKELNNQKESEETQLNLAATYPETARSTCDDVIDWVVNQAYIIDASDNPELGNTSKRRLSYENNEVEEINKRPRVEEETIENEVFATNVSSEESIEIEDFVTIVSSEENVEIEDVSTEENLEIENLATNVLTEEEIDSDFAATEDDFRLVLDDTPPEISVTTPALKVTFFTEGRIKIKDVPKSKRVRQGKPQYLNCYNFTLLPEK